MVAIPYTTELKYSRGGGGGGVGGDKSNVCQNSKAQQRLTVVATLTVT